MRASGPVVAALLAATMFGCSTEELNPVVDLRMPEPDLPELLLPSRIAFGSCSDPSLPLDLLGVAAELEPDLYLWLGDNIYADTADPVVMRRKYQELARTTEFVALRDRTRFLATWDDHDYGANDAGGAFPAKETSREIFFEFWQEEEDSPRRGHEGIYTVEDYEQDGQRLQIIMLDTRFNRDPLRPNDGGGKNDYLPGSGTLLGEQQWSWLEQQFSKPADVRIVGSSIQLAHTYNGYESWTLFPSERERFLALIRSTATTGVIVLSGDVHWGEVSRLPNEDGVDIYDVTSSGINQDWPFVETNDNRVGDAVPEFNVGLLEIDWAARELQVALYDQTRTVRGALQLSFADLGNPR